jgi:hypothetical protein
MTREREGSRDDTQAAIARDVRLLAVLAIEDSHIDRSAFPPPDALCARVLEAVERIDGDR